MTEKFKENIIKAISFVPGLAGLSRLDPSSKSTALPQKDWIKGISIEGDDRDLYIRVGAIIDIDIRAKIVSKEITSSIKQVAQNTNYKIKKIIVYIRGVR